MRKTLPTLAAAALAAACSLPVSRAEDPAPARKVRPYVAWSGPDSRIDKGEYLRVANADDWRRLWARHMGLVDAGGLYGPTIPEVDFDQCMVVAVFEGTTMNTRGVTVVSVTEEKDRLLLRYDVQARSYQSGVPGDRVTPFGIFVFPRCDRPVVIEEDTQSIKNEAPEWKERARFERL